MNLFLHKTTIYDFSPGGFTPSMSPSVKILPMIFVPHTDELNPSIKLFNGVVSKSIDRLLVRNPSKPLSHIQPHNAAYLR